MKYSHHCPYCGKDISADQLLFVKDTGELFRDDVRYSFLNRCCSHWHFEYDNQHEAVFQGEYFRPSAQDTEKCSVTLRDEDGFPRMIRISRDLHGMMPVELTQAAQQGATESNQDTASSSASMQKNDEPDSTGDFNNSSRRPASPKQQQQQRASGKSASPVSGEEFSRLTSRACPHCHSRLPDQFGQMNTVNVAMLGGRAAGKTAYLISLVHQLNTQLGARKLGVATLLDASQQYYELQNDFYQEQHGNPMATPKDERLFPFVFEYHNSIDPSKSCFVAIYDVAGEGMKDMNYMANHAGFQQADIAMMMLDTNMLNNGMYSTQASRMAADAPEAGNADHDCFSDSLDQFLTQSIANIKSYNLMGRLKHVIAVTTKIDYPLMADPKKFTGNSELKYNMERNGVLEHMGAFDWTVQAALEKSIRQFYNNPVDGRSYNILEMISQALGMQRSGTAPANVHLMAVSTWTRVDNDNGEIIFENKYTPDGPKHRFI